MIRKIKSSLRVKVFLLTAVLLVGVSFVVYGTLAEFMPRTYSNELNAALDSRVQSFIAEVSALSMEDSAPLFDSFLRSGRIDRLELLDEEGWQVALPTEYETLEETAVMEMEAVEEAVYDSASRADEAPILSNSYPIVFQDDDTEYTLLVYGAAGQIAPLRQSFIRILPLLAGIVIIVSLAASWAFSLLITKPVLAISRVSRQMAGLDLDWSLGKPRTDELGVLQTSLHDLSHKLIMTLDDLKTANKQLALDIEHEKALEQAQLDFFSAASHELKTPITIIKGQLEGMLLGIGVYKDREKYLARSLEVANTLERMVREILTLSRLEGSESLLQMTAVDCIPLITAYLRETDDLIAQKNYQLDVCLPDSAVVTGNRALLEKVFSNLIGNAVKYAPDGAAIRVTAQPTDGHYIFTVANTGSSIPEKALPKLFDAFYRVDSSRNRKTGGSGLGLYLVQKVLQRHNSQCYVGNTEEGVEFWFIL